MSATSTLRCRLASLAVAASVVALPVGVGVVAFTGAASAAEPRTVHATAGSDDARQAAPSSPASAAVPVAPAGGQLSSGVTLHVGVSLYSPDRTHRLVVADYGDLLLLGPGNSVVWHTGTAGEDDATLSLRTDGNLVLRSAGGRVMWQSGTNGYGASTLTVGDDGRAVLTSSRGASWTSAGLPQRPRGGVSQGSPTGDAMAAWAAAQTFSSKDGCNPYSWSEGRSGLLGPGHLPEGCPPGQTRHSPSAATVNGWNFDFVEVAYDQAHASWGGNRCGFGSPRCTPERGDVAVFMQPRGGQPARLGVVTEVNGATRMMRIAVGDVDGAVLHVWTPVRGSTLEGRPLSSFRTPEPR